MKSHRSRLVAVLVAALAWTSAAQSATFVYVSNADDGDISMFRLDEQTGALTGGDRVKAASLVMPMSISPDQRHLYAAVRSKPYRVFSYEIDRATGKLTQPVTAELPESMPYIVTDRTGRYLFGASYGANLVSVSRIDSNGQVQGQAIQVVPTGRNAHAIGADRTNKFAFATNLGSDQLVQWKFDADTGLLSSNTPAIVQMHAPTGPRHFVISSDNRFVYVLNELIASVTSFKLDPDTGMLSEVSEALGLPDNAGLRPGAPRGAVGGGSATHEVSRDLDHEIWAADLHLTPDGRFLYASERTTSTLATFKVDAHTGRLTYLASTPTEPQPRGFAIDDQGKFLIVAGEKSRTLSVYRIDARSGALSRQGQYPNGKGANWVEIVHFQ